MSLFTLQQKIEEIILLQSMEILCDIEIGKAAFQSLPLQLRANQSLGKVGRVLYAKKSPKNCKSVMLPSSVFMCTSIFPQPSKRRLFSTL